MSSKMIIYSRIISLLLTYLHKFISLSGLILQPTIKCIKSYLDVLNVIKNSICDYFVVNEKTIRIAGSCSPGYEPVKELFLQNFKNGLEDNAQLCVYVNNVCVVDLYGSAMGDSNYGPDNIQVFLLYMICSYGYWYYWYIHWNLIRICIYRRSIYRWCIALENQLLQS